MYRPAVGTPVARFSSGPSQVVDQQWIIPCQANDRRKTWLTRQRVQSHGACCLPQIQGACQIHQPLRSFASICLGAEATTEWRIGVFGPSECSPGPSLNVSTTLPRNIALRRRQSGWRCGWGRTFRRSRRLICDPDLGYSQPCPYPSRLPSLSISMRRGSWQVIAAPFDSTPWMPMDTARWTPRTTST